MTDALAFLRSELDRVGARVAELEAQQESLAKTRAQVHLKISEAEAHSDTDPANAEAIKNTLSHLGLEDEQTAEHQRLVEHQLTQQRKRLDALTEDLEMLQDSSIV